MPVSRKDFHVVAYIAPADKAEGRRLLSHGKLGDTALLDVRDDSRGTFADGYIENNDGKLSLSLGYDHYDVTPGRPARIALDDGTLVVEARRVVDEKGKVLDPRKVSPLSLRVFEAQLTTESRVGAHRERVREQLDAIANLRERFVEATYVHKPSARVASTLPATTRAYTAALARCADKIAGPLDALEKEARALLRAPNSTAAQAARLESKVGRLEDALEIVNLLRERLSSALEQIDGELPAVRVPPRSARARAVAGVDAELSKLLTGASLGAFPQDAIDIATQRLTAIGSPGFDVIGAVTVAPVIGKTGHVLHWAVRFENDGPQPFAGTVVFSDGEKNGGIGLESMALPGKGCAAEQHLIAGGDYGGVRARAGAVVRLGVRSFGWVEIPLPAKKPVTVAVSDFTVENDGQERREDWDRHHLEDKRAEKFGTGKVRFFVNDKPWLPR